MAMTQIPRSKIYPKGEHVWRDWRTGVVWTIVGGTTTIRLMAEQSMRRDKTCATSLLPAGMVVGHPCACRVTGDGADSYVIVEVVSAVFGSDGPRDHAAAVAAGVFHIPRIPPSVAPELGGCCGPSNERESDERKTRARRSV